MNDKNTGAVECRRACHLIESPGGLIYGLVNVRTDGKRLYCATLDEGSTKWRYKVFNSRF